MRHGQSQPRPPRVILALALCLSPVGCTGTHKHQTNHPDTFIGMPPPGSVPTELNKVTLPPYVIEPPDVLLVEVYLPPQDPAKGPVPLYPQPISGQHFVGPDGMIRLGIWGSLPVAGLTVNQAQDAVRRFIFERIKDDETIRKIAAPVSKPEMLLVIVDVLAYNSKKYYVITDGAGYGEQIYPMTSTGNETVLDALALVGGLPTVGSKRNIWVARRSPHPGHPEQILPVDYVGTSQHGVTLTNYQLLPGDRVYVKAEKIFRVDSWLQKTLSPIERVLGITILGASTVNEIKGQGRGGQGNGF
jgi:polysaccharide export outer membrane protein